MSGDFLAQVQQEYRDAFTRQRRNLFVISLVLLFAETSRLTLSKLNVFGNELLIQDPIVVNYALRAAWAYWLLRYLQYLGHVSGLHEIRETYGNRLDGWVREIVRRRAIRECQTPENYYFKEISSRTFWWWRVQHGENILVEGSPQTRRQDDRSTTLKFGDLLLPRIRAWAHVILGTRLATEYVLPFLVALAPGAYWVYRWLS